MSRFDPARPCLFYEGRWRPAEGQRVHRTIDPASLDPVGAWAETTDAERDRALASATAAQAVWAKLDARSRGLVLHKIADRLSDRAQLEPVALQMVRDVGKPYPEAVGELANAPHIFRYYAEMARDDAGKIAGTVQTGSFQYARYEPLGVSVHIQPFNFPILLMCWTVAASLAAGNACIVKPAQATTLTTLAAMALFEDVPPGLIACLPGGADLAQALITSEQTHAVAFTGSVAAARAVGEAAGRALKPVVLEAGGSDALIVTDHAPLGVAVAGSVCAAFHMSGQVCTSAERFFVTEGIHDRFVAQMAQMTGRLRIGHGLGRHDLGPLVSEAARDKVARLVQDAVDKGATLVCGGQIPHTAGPGWFYEPTILTDCQPGMEILETECFGPVAAIRRVADFDAAIAAANDTRFGLGASLFSTSLTEAMAAAEQLQVGMVWINNPLIDNDALPFGGWKQSGVGRELSRAGLDVFRQSKMVVIDHDPVIQDWWYPYDDHVFYPAQGGS